MIRLVAGESEGVHVVLRKRSLAGIVVVERGAVRVVLPKRSLTGIVLVEIEAVHVVLRKHPLIALIFIGSRRMTTIALLGARLGLGEHGGRWATAMRKRLTIGISARTLDSLARRLFDLLLGER